MLSAVHLHPGHLDGGFVADLTRLLFKDGELNLLLLVTFSTGRLRESVVSYEFGI